MGVQTTVKPYTAASYPKIDDKDALRSFFSSEFRGIEQALKTQRQASFQSVVTPEMFGASDGNPNNKRAFQALTAYINDLGAGVRVVFGSGKIYVVWDETVTNQDVIFFLDTTRAVTFDFNGAQIRSKGVWNSGVIAYLFLLSNCVQTTFINANFFDEQSEALSAPTDDYGANWFWLQDATIQTEIINPEFTGGRGAISFFRTGSNDALLGYGLEIDNAIIRKCFYGLNTGKNGDQVHATLRCYDCGRSYFVYNVNNHVVQLTDFFGGVIVPGILLAATTDDTEPGRLNTLSNISLDYTFISEVATVPHAALCRFAFGQGTNVSTPGFMHDIKVRLNIFLPGTVVAVSDILSTQKTDFALAPDATPRGHEFENIDISGKINGANTNVQFVNLFNDSDWTGEFVRNVRIHDVQGENCNLALIAVDAGCFTGGPNQGNLVIENVHGVSGAGAPACDLDITNAVPGKVYLRNIITPSYKTHILLTDADGVTWQQGGGVEPVLNTGLLEAKYARDGNRVKVTLLLLPDGTTTFGDGAAPYFFTLPTAYAHEVVQPSDVFPAYGDAAGAIVPGIGYVANTGGGVYFRVYSGGGQWSKTVPGVWANGNTLQFTANYDV